MQKELEEKLFDTFPNLYADRHADPSVSLVCFGFEVGGDGWFQLLWDLSEKLEKIIIAWKAKYPKEENFPRAVQMKEKMAGLRFYMSNYLDEFEEPIAEAERKSYVTCEICGEVGEVMSNGYWLKTLCPKHVVYKTHWGEDSVYRQIKIF